MFQRAYALASSGEMAERAKAMDWGFAGRIVRRNPLYGSGSAANGRHTICGERRVAIRDIMEAYYGTELLTLERRQEGGKAHVQTGV